jgi:ankyrin repeat protein
MRGAHPGWWIGRWPPRLALLACLIAMTATTPGAAGRDASLVDAVKNADTAAVRALLQQHHNVNLAEADGTTPLHWAVHRDDLATVDVLIGAGANVKAVNRFGVTPLALACENGSAGVIERLIKAGADPNTVVADGETVLMTAARGGNVAAIEVLLARGADVNALEQWRGQSALMWAAAEGNAAAATALIAAGAGLEVRSKGGFTPLLFAVRGGQIAATEVLLTAGANVNTALPDGTSALVLAVTNAHYELAVRLLDRGADPNADAQGWTALHQLVWTRKPNKGYANPGPVPTGTLDGLVLVKELAAHGGNLNARESKEPKDGYRNLLNRVGATPFLLAAKSADVDLMRALVVAGADPSITTADHTTPLMAAAGVGIWAVGESAGTNEEALEAVKLALDLGGDVTAVNDYGQTALHGAAHRGANDIVQLLADRGARLNPRVTKSGGGNVGWKAGWTPLTIADGLFYANSLKRYPETAALLRRLMTERGVPFDAPPAPGDGAAPATTERRQ